MQGRLQWDHAVPRQQELSRSSLLPVWMFLPRCGTLDLPPGHAWGSGQCLAAWLLSCGSHWGWSRSFWTGQMALGGSLWGGSGLQWRSVHTLGPNPKAQLELWHRPGTFLWHKVVEPELLLHLSDRCPACGQGRLWQALHGCLPLVTVPSQSLSCLVSGLRGQVQIIR